MCVAKAGSGKSVWSTLELCPQWREWERVRYPNSDQSKATPPNKAITFKGEGIGGGVYKLSVVSQRGGGGYEGGHLKLERWKVSLKLEEGGVGRCMPTRSTKPTKTSSFRPLLVEVGQETCLLTNHNDHYHHHHYFTIMCCACLFGHDNLIKSTRICHTYKLNMLHICNYST